MKNARLVPSASTYTTAMSLLLGSVGLSLIWSWTFGPLPLAVVVVALVEVVFACELLPPPLVIRTTATITAAARTASSTAPAVRELPGVAGACAPLPGSPAPGGEAGVVEARSDTRWGSCAPAPAPTAPVPAPPGTAAAGISGRPEPASGESWAASSPAHARAGSSLAR